MNTHQGSMQRRISIKTQISSSSSAQLNQVITPKSRENSQSQFNKQISINNNNTNNMEGVITESDSCLNMASNNQFIINSRHAAFMNDENISNPSSQNTIVNTINVQNQLFKGEGVSGNHFQSGNTSYTSYASQQLSQQQNVMFVNAFKDKRLTPTMRRTNEANQFNYENHFFNSQKLKNNNNSKRGGAGSIDDGGGGNENEPQSYRNTAKEFSSIDLGKHRIDLQQRQLQRIPVLIQEMKNSLQELNLSYNNFIIFPQELCQFLHLKILRLDFNYLSEIPEQIAFLKYLEELSISHNCLKELPGTLQNMSNLRILNVGANNISQIGQEVTNIKKLEILYIYNNEFTVLPSKIRNLIHLKELGLDWFRYTKPPIDTLLIRPAQNGLFAKLFDLCGQHSMNAKPSISFKDFVKHFSLIDGSTDFSKVDARGRTIAFLATESEELGVLKALLEENKDILNLLDREGQTLLTQALIDNKVRSVQFLLENGADPRKGGGHLGSSLHMVTSKLNQELVIKFLQLGVNPNSVDFEGSTPLHIAFSIFQKDPLAARVISEQLLSNGADPNILNKDFWAPLHISVRKNQKDAVKYALEYNEKLMKKLNINSLNQLQNLSNNNSALHNQNEDDNSAMYQQDSRDSQRRIASYNVRSDFIDEQNRSSYDIERYDAASPSKSTLFQQSNSSTPKIGSEDIILHNRNTHTMQDTLNLSKKSSNQFNHQEEDLSDENEDRSPGQTHRTANFNNQQQLKLSKNCRKFFKFDKKGGANKWTVMHLSSNQGNINMLEILSEANSCPYSFTKFNQTPRKVALQSLILFKILRKYENRWMLKNVLGEECQSEFSARENVVERNIQNLRGFIAETMKRKEHFLHEQLDLFDDKEFGYAIKENMQNNKAQNPRNKENGNESDEDEILDPELSFDKTATSFKFNGIQSQSNQQIMVGGSETISGSNSLIMPPNSGTLKPQQFGSLLRQNSKGQQSIKFNSKDEKSGVKKLERPNVDEQENEDDDEDMMNDIDECDEDNDTKYDADDFEEDSGRMKKHNAVNGAVRNIVKINNNVDERSCVFMKNVPNINTVPMAENNQLQIMFNFSEFKGGDSKSQMVLTKQQEIDEQQKQIELIESTLTTHFFTDIQSLEAEKFQLEIERLKNHCIYPNTIFQESLNALMLLQMIHIRLSYRNMKFISDKGTLPRNIHIMNEFLHSKMPQTTITEQIEFLPSLLVSFLYDLLNKIKPLPNIDPDQGTVYFQFNRIAQASRQNQLINLLILRTRDILCTLNCYDFFSEFQKKCLKTYTQSTINGEKDHVVAFSTSDYTNTTFLDYENLQNMYYINAIKPAVSPNPNPNHLNNYYMNSSSNSNSNIHNYNSNNDHGNKANLNMYKIVGSPTYFYHQKQQISSRSRKSQSQTSAEMLKLKQQGYISSQNNTKSINKNYIPLEMENQKNSKKNLPIPINNNRTAHLSIQKEGDNNNNYKAPSTTASNNSLNQGNNKNSKSFIQETFSNQQLSFTDVSNQVTYNQTERKLLPKTDSHQNTDPNQNNSSANPQFIQLRSRIEEPKMPNELKKIDLNTFGVNSSQYQFAQSSLQKNQPQIQALQNQQPPGPKNLKNNNTTYISKPNVEEPLSGVQQNINMTKLNQGRIADSSFTQSMSTHNYEINQQQGINVQKNSFQQSDKLNNYEQQIKQTYENVNKYSTNYNKKEQDGNRSFVQIPSTQPSSQNYQYYTSKQQSQVKPEISQKQLNNYNNNDGYQNSIKNDQSQQKHKKYPKLQGVKTGEENISDEDLSDDSSKQRTQDASQKYSDHKMQFSPFNKKI